MCRELQANIEGGGTFNISGCGTPYRWVGNHDYHVW